MRANLQDFFVSVLCLTLQAKQRKSFSAISMNRVSNNPSCMMGWDIWRLTGKGDVKRWQTRCLSNEWELLLLDKRPSVCGLWRGDALDGCVLTSAFLVKDRWSWWPGSNLSKQENRRCASWMSYVEDYQGKKEKNHSSWQFLSKKDDRVMEKDEGEDWTVVVRWVSVCPRLNSQRDWVRNYWQRVEGKRNVNDDVSRRE